MADRDWHLFLGDMLTFSKRALAYCEGHSKESFLEDEMRQDAVLRNLELIGEAATRIPPYVRERHEAIAWRQIIATRNQLIHAYLGIDNDIIWDIIQVELPLLIKQLSSLDLED